MLEDREQRRTEFRRMFDSALGKVSPYKDWLSGTPLLEALETAVKCTEHIPREVERIEALKAEAKNEIELAARDYQIWYINKYLNRASTAASKRLAHFQTLNTEAAIAEEVAKCKTDQIYWFEMYAWGYDPRARTSLSIVPFSPYPKQQELLTWLDDIVFNRRASGLIEKARDEGVTELMVRWGLRHWLWTPGFSMLLSTRKEDEIDAKKNPNTLFARARFQVTLLPAWQWPEGFDVDKSMLASMKLVNPANNNTLLGEAPVENIGRGARVTCAMPDEYAFWPFAGYPQYRSLSQTTDSIIAPSSVAGRLNQFADLAFDGITPKFTLDWRDNPFKDKRWYDALSFGYISPKLSATTIAQEIDRNYDAAQPGRVWKYGEEYIFITQSEFLRPFQAKNLEHKFFDDKGNFRVPLDWRVTRCHDYGQSSGHDWSYLLGAQPRESYPLHDTHFIFIAQNLEPTGLTTDEAVRQWRRLEEGIGIRKGVEWIVRPYASYNSHEQDDLRKVLLKTYGESWIAWNTDYYKGITTIEDWWIPVDREQPNPFRPELQGRCRLVFVAPDSEYMMAHNERLATWFVTSSQTEAGFLTARKQFAAYHYPETELGKAVKAMRPVKEFDDIVDALRGYAVNWNRRPIPLTREEQIEQQLPQPLRADTIKVMSVSEERDSVITRRVMEVNKIAREMDRPLRRGFGMTR